jgi:hypothetical protein
MADDDLRQRLKDIFRNFMTVNSAGKSSPIPASNRWHSYWRVRFVHVLEEMTIRFGRFPAGLGIPYGSPIFFPDPRSKRALSARQAADVSALDGKLILTKYGVYEHLEQTLLAGRVRVSPASAFADPQHNRAIQDNELESIHWMFEPSADELLPYAALPGFDSIQPGGSVALTRFTEDHYLYCLSSVYDPWILDDFDYDACLIVDDPKTFVSRLMWRVHAALEARGHAFSPVTYVDPMTHIDRTVPITLQKHARHQYQHEVRGVWLPKAGSGPLEATFVEIGSLEGIARIIRI